MKMTFEQYINNPMGLKNSVYSNRFVYRDLYTEKLNTILVREAGSIKYFLYQDKNKYYVHMKVPSEVIKNFYYDTVIEMYTDNKDSELSRTLKDYYVKFYSNDPSFVFTFAHAMLKNDMFIKDLVPRMSKQAVLKAAKEKNAKNEIGYVKSVYFTYLLMKRNSLFNKINYESQAKPYDKKSLLKNIEHADITIEKRQEAQKELNEQKRLEKDKKRQERSRQRSLVQQNPSPTMRMSNVSNVSNSSKIVKSVNKKNKYIKTSSRTKKI